MAWTECRRDPFYLSEKMFLTMFSADVKLKWYFQKFRSFAKVSKISCDGKFSKFSNSDDVLKLFVSICLM